MSAAEDQAAEGLAILAALHEALAIDGPLVAFDLETTGTNVSTDRIVELALLHVSPNGFGSFFQTLVNPGVPIPPGATEIHGITDADVKDMPTFDTLAGDLFPQFDGAVVAGYNIRGFDVPLLLAEFSRTRRGAPQLVGPGLDAFAIFRRREPHDLSHAMETYCGHPHANAHNALADTVAAVSVLRAMLARYPDLPRTGPGLADYCLNRHDDWVDDDGRFVWRAGEVTLTFGKYTGKTLRVLAVEERSFLSWILSKDFSESVKQIVRDALAGTFPTPPAGT